jgi:hypothetical protein
MRVTAAIVVTFHVFQATEAKAGQGCRKDACYSAVAIQREDNPPSWVRKSDCRSALSTVIYDRTVTHTTHITLAVKPATATQTVYDVTVTKTMPGASNTHIKMKRDVPPTPTITDEPQNTETSSPDDVALDSEVHEILPRDKVSDCARMCNLSNLICSALLICD